MKVFKLKGLGKYAVCPEGATDEYAAIIFLKNRIGVTPDDIEEADVDVPAAYNGMVLDQETIDMIQSN